jgi:hypothetical protein
MGVLPLESPAGQTRESLGLTGHEVFDVAIDDGVKPRQQLTVTAIHPETGKVTTFAAQCRIDTPVEVDYYRNGGILQSVLRKLLAESGGRPAKTVAKTAAAKTARTAAPAPAPVKKMPVKKMTAKKTPAKRTAPKRTAPKPAATRKPAARKPAPKKPNGKRPARKKPQARRAAAKPKSRTRGRR